MPRIRIRRSNDAPIRTAGRYVLYWMIAARRAGWSFALDRALEHARALDRPLLVLEALRCDYRWASDRHHAFVLDGMRDNAAAFSDAGIGYYPYVEPAAGAGRGLLERAAADAAVVVTDDYPCFFLPRMVAAAAARLAVRLEAVDGHGLLPMAAADRAFARAYDFRRFLHRALAPHLLAVPQASPTAEGLPRAPRLASELRERWSAAPAELLAAGRDLAALPIDHRVPAAATMGGAVAGERQLAAFLARLERYDRERNQPASEATSGLSPYLHYGHVSAHEVFWRLVGDTGWSPDELPPDGRGQRAGWWGLDAAREGFLDQLVTWRELGFNACRFLPDYDGYESLPSWARRTLGEHAADPRPHLYDHPTFAGAATHDEIWNAAQRQLVADGVIHNYLRMLWGKKILHWSESPRAALEIMIDLNNRYALDGRDPNSYSGIFWTLGRYDRAWGPERPVFGKIRFMSSANTRRKLRLGPYLERWGRGQGELFDARM